MPSDPDMAARLTWAGHATVLLELDGVRLLTDPALRRRMAHLVRRAPAPAGVAADVDAVLISHLHRDHLDLPSLRRLAGRPLLIAPRGGRSVLRRAPGEVVEVEPGDVVRVGGLEVTATHAAHDGRRGTGAEGPALGYVVDGARRVYFAGDTGLFPGMAGLAGDLDVALLPVWGWGPRLGEGHLDPLGAAQALRLLRPRIAVPIHWGTYRPAWTAADAPYLSAPGEAFARHAARLAPGVEVRVLAPGEATTLSR